MNKYIRVNGIKNRRQSKTTLTTLASITTAQSLIAEKESREFLSQVGQHLLTLQMKRNSNKDLFCRSKKLPEDQAVVALTVSQKEDHLTWRFLLVQGINQGKISPVCT